jgi:hypothetical protein
MSVESRLNSLEEHTGVGEEPLLIRLMRVDVHGNRRLERTIYCDPAGGGVIRSEPAPAGGR